MGNKLILSKQASDFALISYLAPLPFFCGGNVSSLETYQGAGLVVSGSIHQPLPFLIMPLACISRLFKQRRVLWVKLPTRCASKASMLAKISWHAPHCDLTIMVLQ
jgi:hypothetical protein